ncbi:hypothetical protein QVD17_04859 [Tagetes erecta]|uniref:Replication protein A 70 kDa DNA-binding subunit B/D first OB fold domain-containing protein n=1 Tax=Tagetes erecta TaxID=13708 RepID=A0AAD8LDY7_TARER|nr:hypothetical protein QVD17_04859 [Tagetes erecta]
MNLQPINTAQLRDSRSPEHSRIRLFRQIDLARQDYSLKFLVIRLWKQPMHNNEKAVYSLEMIVMDEEGTRMQCNVLKKWFEKFEPLLEETGAFLLRNI